jgi:hypothetical protein
MHRASRSSQPWTYPLPRFVLPLAFNREIQIACKIHHDRLREELTASLRTAVLLSEQSAVLPLSLVAQARDNLRVLELHGPCLAMRRVLLLLREPNVVELFDKKQLQYRADPNTFVSLFRTAATTLRRIETLIANHPGILVQLDDSITQSIAHQWVNGPDCSVHLRDYLDQWSTLPPWDSSVRYLVNDLAHESLALIPESFRLVRADTLPMPVTRRILTSMHANAYQELLECVPLTDFLYMPIISLHFVKASRGTVSWPYANHRLSRSAH